MIDRTTISQILDTADIVDVVSDFVTLKKRGANWVGLCPFHNDRTPSFYVSRAKGICKCFSCGQGGSAVNFIMLHEQMTYVEALKYLANKYHIEVKERELTDEERTEQTERESMLVLNEWACQFFEKRLWESTDGQEIGLSYFRQRGFSDATIRKFRLGYCPEDRTALYRAAIGEGYSRDLLFKLGLCKDDNHGGGFDFYRGRVMFPIFNVAGKVIAFGGRTLKKGDHAKYFNSPDSIIYNKSHSTMYGLFQAKRAIASQGKCFIVEGYADVISMHQAGFENVIASSGTSLTEGHIHLLHRFTENVTELFDGDEAGIKAALRGIDMLLKEGLNIKVLLLPEGEDPDSYAQSHNASWVEQYIAENETDFISFKTHILLKDAQNDPIKRSQAITEVVKSIAMIPTAITRSVYAKECASIFGIEEKVLLREIEKHIRKNRDEEFKRREREKRRGEGEMVVQEARDESEPTPPDTPIPPVITVTPPIDKETRTRVSAIYRQEQEVLRYIVKYGMCYLCETELDNGEKVPTTVLEFIHSELTADNIQLTNHALKAVYDSAVDMIPEFYSDLAAFEQDIHQQADNECRSRFQSIDPTGLTSSEIDKKEQEVRNAVNAEFSQKINDFRMAYLERRLCSHPDDEVRNISYELMSEKNQLSKIYTQYGPLASDFDRLLTLIPKSLYNLKNAIVNQQIKQMQKQMQQAGSSEQSEELMEKLQELYAIRRQLSKFIGDRVVAPK
ncbi:MAG: DNA primase [Muribaculaceae bacterium]|nr:DNA primase [Muribaculaceae bacterium]